MGLFDSCFGLLMGFVWLFSLFVVFLYVDLLCRLLIVVLFCFIMLALGLY